MQATAIAQPNIALIKYWGKRDLALNLPAVGSISITLDTLQTTVSIDLDSRLAKDSLVVNGVEDPGRLGRMSACLDNVIGIERPSAVIETSSNFPIAAGLASSASAFAAATLAAAAAANIELDTDSLAGLAGRASGSAARSFFGGFAELENCGDAIRLTSLCDAESWPLNVVVAITDTTAKGTGSTEAMEISRKTSPFYGAWIERQADDLATARRAIGARDFSTLAAVAEHNCLKMHSVMWASRPPVVFWNAATMQCLHTVRRLQQEGCRVFFTIDAGPQVKAVCHEQDMSAVRDALSATVGVQEILTTGLGPAAHLVRTS